MDRADLLKKVERFKELLIQRSENGYPDSAEYAKLRQEIVSHREIEHLLPQMVKLYRTPAEFWSYIKSKFGRWHERREHLQQEFHPLLTALETGELEPNLQPAEEALRKLNSDDVEFLMTKALRRTRSDPDGAVTAAKSLIESTCKLILDDMQKAYGSNPKLPDLFKAISKELKLHPDEHPNDSLKQILRSCASIVQGFAEIRNSIGDAHGQGRNPMKAAPRHARLVVGAAGFMSAFLVETYEHKKAQDARKGSQLNQ